MKKNYIKPDIVILKIGTGSGICAVSHEQRKAEFLIGDDREYEARYDKKWTISGDVDFDNGEVDSR